jgi:hypothetical protein
VKTRYGSVLWKCGGISVVCNVYEGTQISLEMVPNRRGNRILRGGNGRQASRARAIGFKTQTAREAQSGITRTDAEARSERLHTGICKQCGCIEAVQGLPQDNTLRLRGYPGLHPLS